MILLKTASRDRLKLFGQKQMPNPDSSVGQSASQWRNVCLALIPGCLKSYVGKGLLLEYCQSRGCQVSHSELNLNSPSCAGNKTCK